MPCLALEVALDLAERLGDESCLRDWCERVGARLVPKEGTLASKALLN